MILSIESSCDDSGIAITKIDNKKLIFHKKISQDEEHSLYGGVVPELAARLHAVALPKILNGAKEYFSELKAVAVTNEPGLSVTLIEGVTMAKSLSVSLGIPILPINHLKGHIYSLFIEKEAIFPLFVLLVSGGHTQILHMENYDDIKVLGSTKDDSFGESFDKVAKMLSLGYPGGPIVEKYAKQGDSKRFSFTTPLLQTKEIAFSYSGLKNQTRLAINTLGKLKQKDKYDICASFQQVAIEHIINKTERVFKQSSIKNFAVVGGASANKILKNKLEKICTKYGTTFLTAPLKFCSDNAAMIGRCALEAYSLKRFVSFENIEINPRSKL